MNIPRTIACLLVSVCFTLGAHAQDTETNTDTETEEETTGVIQPEMAQMSCLQIVDALNAESEILGGAPERGLISNNQVVNLGTNVGQRIARDAGHGNFSIGLGIGGRVLGQNMRNREAEEATEREEATRRWYYLSGIYDGRDCDSLIASELAEQ